jgi:hypothetical protein
LADDFNQLLFYVNERKNKQLIERAAAADHSATRLIETISPPPTAAAAALPTPPCSPCVIPE